MIDVPRSKLKDSGALTATATAGDGSTSEFSPCIKIGDSAPSFIKSGVALANPTVTASPATAADARAASAANTKKKKGRTGLTATLRPFCPPITTRYCAGTITLRQASNRHKIARITFKLAPGELGTLPLRLSSALTKLLEHDHQVRLAATIAAHDGARHAHHTSHTTRLTLRHATKD